MPTSDGSYFIINFITYLLGGGGVCAVISCKKIHTEKKIRGLIRKMVMKLLDVGV